MVFSIGFCLVCTFINRLARFDGCCAWFSWVESSRTFVRVIGCLDFAYLLFRACKAFAWDLLQDLDSFDMCCTDVGECLRFWLSLSRGWDER